MTANSRRGLQNPSTARRSRIGRDDIIPDRQRGDDTVALAILRNIGDARLDRAPGALQRDRGAVDPRRPRRRTGEPEQGAHHLASSGAHQAIEAENFAASQLKRDVRELEWRAQSRDFEDDVSDRHLHLGKYVREGASDHHPDDVRFGHVANIAVADKSPVAQHHVAVRDLEDFIELMRDEDDRLAGRALRGDDREQVLDLARRKRGGRLVEDQDPGLVRESAGHADQMLLRQAKVADAGIHVDVEIEVVEQGARVRAHSVPVDQNGRAVGRRPIDVDVLGH